MTILSLKEFMENYKLKDDTMKESDLRKVYIYNIYPRGYRIVGDKEFVNTDNGEMVGVRWVCLLVKDIESYQFDSFGGSPDNVLLNQLQKSKVYDKSKIQDINSKL